MKMRKQMPKQQKREPDDLISRIKGYAEDSISLVSQWEQNQVKWHKMRMRIKKEKSFPFSGCANLRMPTIETKLRKLKSALINVIFGIRPIVQVIPSPSGRWETARKIEKFLDHMIMDVMKVKEKAIIAVDQMLEKGFYLLKPYWKIDIITRSEDLSLEDLPEEELVWLFDEKRNPGEVVDALIKKFDVDMNDLTAKDNYKELTRIIQAIGRGEKKITVNFQDVICNYPDVALCEPERVYVPTDAGVSPQSCSYIIHEFQMPFETVKLNGTVKGWDTKEITEISNTKERMKDKEIDTQKEIREGITILEKTGKIRVWEFYGFENIDGKGKKKCVITLAPDFDKVLRKMAVPFHSGKFNFVKLFYELTDDRWFSHRGIPELIEDIVKEIDIQHMQKIDQQTMRNSQQYLFRAGMVNPNAVQFVFGQGYPVKGLQPLDDLMRPLDNNNPNVEFSYEREQMILESKVEELIGQIDFTLQSMINKREPRTLGEVQLQHQNMQMVFGLDSEILKMSFEELFNWIWELWCQYGDDAYEFMYFGKEGYEPIKLSREETQGHYKITIRGNDQNTNPQIRIQKAQMILMAQNNPTALQTGVVTPMNIANGLKRFYQELDIPGWEELVTMPQPQPPAPPQIGIALKDLTDSEQAQVLARYGIQPDVQGRALKSQAITQQKAVEQRNESIKTMTTTLKGGNGAAR